jgi:hypothetical protein
VGLASFSLPAATEGDYIRNSKWTPEIGYNQTHAPTPQRGRDGTQAEEAGLERFLPSCYITMYIDVTQHHADQCLAQSNNAFVVSANKAMQLLPFVQHQFLVSNAHFLKHDNASSCLKSHCSSKLLSGQIYFFVMIQTHYDVILGACGTVDG